MTGRATGRGGGRREEREGEKWRGEREGREGRKARSNTLFLRLIAEIVELLLVVLKPGKSALEFQENVINVIN